jgi:hypothetical protein
MFSQAYFNFLGASGSSIRMVGIMVNPEESVIFYTMFASRSHVLRGVALKFFLAASDL